ncbi:Gluconate transport-inducing protein [Aspergillus melleus]|uniref:Gluconate transport-inducing protein n=1 Tax=Aspergillus melleus TaxID=138277 RepID=A0ACC3AX61_9EURO|nr:Gluconate transport-inducing protein [Aspergillus melleus]
METYHGHVRTPADAIILFEACRIGLLPRVQRRLSEKERQMIRSGSVFVWDEREAGMRRWTDGKSWSASRVSGSFLTYREMEGKRGGTSVSSTTIPRAGKTPESARGSDDDRADGPDEGPDGYRYKPDGLMKQSFSITTSTGQHLHLISYYSRSHPSAANLQQPSSDPNLRHVRPQKGLYPESTVNDQQNLPVVTRGPMQGAAYPVPPHPMGAYARAAATHPQPYTPTYAWPPTPLATPPTVPVHYPSYLPPAPPSNGQVAAAYGHHPQQAHAGLPPPPPQQHGLSTPYERAVHPAEAVMPQTVPHTAVQHAPLPVIAGRSPRLVTEAHELHPRSPPEYGPAPADLRRASPRTHAHSIPHTNGLTAMTRSPRLLSQPPAPAPPGAAAKIAETGPGTTVPSIGSLMNGGPLRGSLPSIAVPPTANGRAEGPRDIPSDKVGFGGEDMRALRQLDRVFTA